MCTRSAVTYPNGLAAAGSRTKSVLDCSLIPLALSLLEKGDGGLRFRQLLFLHVGGPQSGHPTLPPVVGQPSWVLESSVAEPCSWQLLCKPVCPSLSVCYGPDSLQKEAIASEGLNV